MDILVPLIVLVIVIGVLYLFATRIDAVEEETFETPEVEEQPKRKTTKPPKSFSKMTKKELLAYAEENGIDANSRDTKAEIVKKIKSDF
jgi:trans-2-enoyl-CoA reductase